MKRPIINVLAAFGLATTVWAGADAAAAEAKSYPTIKPFGYVQFTGSAGSGAAASQFGFEKARLGFKGDIDEHLSYRLLLDLLKLNSPAKSDTTPEGLADAVLSYRVLPALKLSAGQFKTPFGMEYSTPASKLDVIGFGMVTNVTLDRGLGLMAGGRNVANSGIGYDLAVFNAGTRADGTAYTAYTAGTTTRGKMMMGRLLFDGLDQAIHLEGGAARSVVATGLSYTATYAGLRLNYQPLELKAEWLNGRQGTRRTTVVYGQLLATVLENFELVGKWQRTRYTDTGVNLTADNMIFGLNAALYPDKPKKARLQFNYVIATRDAKSLGAHVGFKKGYKANEYRLLLQLGF